MSIKNSNDTIGNQTRDLPACSAVPQPTAPLRAPNNLFTTNNFRNSNQEPPEHNTHKANVSV
jgi:hypothetical protein